MRTLPVRFYFRQTLRIPHVDPHRSETVPVRTVRSVLSTETIAQTTHQPLPQSVVRASAPAGKDSRMSGMSQGVQTQRQPDQTYGCARSRFQHTRETARVEIRQTKEDTDDRRPTS